MYLFFVGLTLCMIAWIAGGVFLYQGDYVTGGVLLIIGLLVLISMIAICLYVLKIMPSKRHKESRSLFIREAKKLCQEEFKRWFKLTTGINHFLGTLFDKESPIPTLFIMGDEDHMFLPFVAVEGASELLCFFCRLRLTVKNVPL